MDDPRKTDSRSSPPLRRLAERFELLRFLGEGGMGTVYLARDVRFDRPLAVKVLLGAEPEALARFKQEFRALADISHPNLIVLHELLCDGSTWLFTMDYVEGRDFLTHVSALERRDAPTLLEVTADRTRQRGSGAGSCLVRDHAMLERVLVQLTDAVITLHRAGKLHLDLKPSNVLVSADDHVTVLDFGLARDLDKGARTTQRLLGTPAYMAPEHAQGDPFEPASDWYAVGVMLYEALTGRLPFEGPVAHILLSKTSRDPEPPSAHCRDVPPALDALCMRLLARAPSQRARGEDILAALDRPVLASAQALSPTISVREPFVGRERLLEQLAAHSEAPSGPRVLLLHGSSGVGKTTLARHFVDELATRPRALVLRGACYEREAVPYKAFDGIVDALIARLAELAPLELGALLPRHASSLARLFPAFATLCPPPRHTPADDGDAELGRARAFRAFAELFGRLSDRYELALFIDDLHWSDLDSALLLRALFEESGPLALLLIGTYRDHEAPNPVVAALRELAASPSKLALEEAELDALAPTEAETLARELLAHADLDDGVAARIASESHGVPLFIHELARHVASDGAHVREVSLGDMLARRIAALPAPARELLDVLALAGRPLARRAGVRAAALGASEGSALHTLRVAGLLKSRGPRPEDALELAHDRLRTVLLDRLPEPRALHARLLSALEREPQPDDEQLYVHARGAGLLARALLHAERAAERAQHALAAHRGVELYRAALELARDQPRDAERTLRLTRGLAEALSASGHNLDAGQVYLDAAALADDEQEQFTLERKAADQLLRGGELAQGTELLARVLERVGVSYPRSAGAALAALTFERTRLFARGLSFEERAPAHIDAGTLELLASLQVALGVYWLVEPVRGALFATLYLRHALDAGHARHVLRGLETEAAYVSLIGGAKAEARAGELYQSARLLTQRIGSASTRSGYKLAEAGFHAIYGRKQKSSECALEALTSPRQQGASWERAYALFHVYQNTLYIGGRPGLADEVREHVLEREARRDRFGSATLLPMLALTCLMADRPDEAEQALSRMRAQLSPDVFSFLDMQALIWSALTHGYAGRPEQALALYEASAGRYALSGVPRLSTWRLLHQWGVMLAHLAALAEGGSRRHARAAEACIRRIERDGSAWPRPFAALGRAALHHARGEEGARDDALARAVQESEALGYRPFAVLFARSQALFARDGEAVARQEATLRELGIASPVGWQRTWAPGLAPRT